MTIYSFNGKGKGDLVLPLGTYEFRYVLEDDVLQIDFADESIEDRSYKYSLTQDILIIMDEDGTSYQFIGTEMPK